MFIFTITMIMVLSLATLATLDIFHEEMLEDSINDWQDNAMVQREHERLVKAYVMYAEESIQYRQALGWDTDDEPTEWEEATEEYELPLSEYADETELSDKQQHVWDRLGSVFTVEEEQEEDVKQAFKDGWEKGARARERVLSMAQRVLSMAHEVNHFFLQDMHEYAHILKDDVCGMYHDVRHQVQQVVWYYQASKAKDITPTKVVRVRPTVGGVHTPLLLPACYEQQVD